MRYIIHRPDDALQRKIGYVPGLRGIVRTRRYFVPSREE